MPFFVSENVKRFCRKTFVVNYALLTDLEENIFSKQTKRNSLAKVIVRLHTLELNVF
jgi:hypothetical protein